MNNYNLSVGDMADKIGVTPSAVYLWINGSRVPDRKYMAKIFDLTDGQVQPNDFYELPFAGAEALAHSEQQNQIGGYQA